MMKSTGKIVIASGVNVWPHELETAKALAKAGMEVEFLVRREGQRETSADVIIDGVEWEIKSPESDKTKVIEKNIRKALKQADCVVFDSRRMKKLPDATIEREVRKWSGELRSLRRMIYVNRRGDILVIK